MLEVLYAVEKPSWAYDNSIYWMCKCDCGNGRVYAASRLRSPYPPKSCGCALYERLDGKKFNLLTVLYENGRDHNGKRMWHCICDCGIETDIEASSLINGYTKSCGCLKHKKENLLDQRFGRWIVVSRAPSNKSRKTFWNCKCDCGNEKIVSTSALKSGKSKSCGCLARNLAMDKVEDLTGQKFGRWTVIEIQRIKKNNESRVFWLCKCDCGNTKVVAARTLKSGDSQSCGCLKKERLHDSNTLEEGEAGFNKVLKNYKRGARDRGLSFELDNDSFRKLTKGNCYYCGEEPKNIGKSLSITADYIYNGIDRLNNRIGYTIENSVTCCKRCNMMKMELSIEDFSNRISTIYHYFVNKEK
jgi:hypothetical protein